LKQGAGRYPLLRAGALWRYSQQVIYGAPPKGTDDRLAGSKLSAGCGQTGPANGMPPPHGKGHSGGLMAGRVSEAVAKIETRPGA